MVCLFCGTIRHGMMDCDRNPHKIETDDHIEDVVPMTNIPPFPE